MKKFLFPVILLLSIVSFKTFAEEYKIRFSGCEYLQCGYEGKYAVVKKINDTTWYVRQTTAVKNWLTGLVKWWDHDVTFSRVCLLEKDGEDVLEEEFLEDEVQNLNSKDGWDDYSGSISDSCIEGDGGLFQLPENIDIKDYSIEIKWIEDDEEKYVIFELTDQNLE